jgi:hypothetical protein
VGIKNNFLEDSLLITTKEDKLMLKEWLGKDVIVTNLIYRASRDGYDAQSYH